MSEQTPANTFTLTLAGREILFNKTSPGQITAMQRYIDKIRIQMIGADETTISQLFTKINKIMLDVIDTRFADEQDREYIEKQLMFGAIDIRELMVVLSNGNKPKPATPDDEPPTPVKKAAKKPARKPAAKKTTNPRRAKQ